MNTTGILYTIFFSVIVIVSLYVLGFFHNMKKYSLLNQSNFSKNLVRNLLVVIILFVLIILLIFKNKHSSNSNLIEFTNVKKPETFESERKPIMIHRCGREWNGKRDETYGVYGDYCCLYCYADLYPN